MRRQRIGSFALAFMCLLALQYLVDYREFRADAGLYWDLASIENLRSFPKTFRGYVFPLMLLPARMVGAWIGGSGLDGFRLWSSLLVAYTLTGPVSDLFIGLLDGYSSMLRRLMLPGLVVLFFPGLVLHPLTDLPAFVLLALGLTALWRGLRRAEMHCVFLAGVSLAAAYNVRTIYIVSLLLAFALVAFARIEGLDARRRILAFVTMGIGIFVVFIPQWRINVETHGKSTPMVQATSVSGKPLMPAQLQWGITLQRYETIILPDGSAGAMYFLDENGELIFSHAGLDASPIASLSAYALLVSKEPISFLAIYGRHLVNGLDLRDGRVYGTEGPLLRMVLSVLGFMAAIVAALVWLEKRPNIPTLYWSLAVLLAPVLAILPGAVETRFFLPLHMVLFALLAFNFQCGRIVAFFQSRTLVVTLVVVSSMAVMVTISNRTMASASLVWPEVYR